MNRGRPFWQAKALHEMSASEWESLCDGCGKCCLNKLEDWDTGDIYFTNVACALFDDGTCRCSDYANRAEKMPDCVQLTPAKASSLPWLPASCAYRRISEGRGLPDWHHLVCGDPDRVHATGNSVRGRTISEEGMEPEDLERHLVDWL